VVLQPEQAEYGMFWRCRGCGGFAISLAVLRVLFTPESINPLWLNAIDAVGGLGEPGCACPSCSNAMTEVPLSGVREHEGLVPQEVITPPQSVSEHAMAQADRSLREAEALERANRWRAIAIGLRFNPFL
jgi:hypothetical protein